MTAVTRRSYAGAAPACTLTSGIGSGDTTASLTGTVTNWPTTAGGPFHMVIDPGLSTEEKVLVGSRSTGSLSSITLHILLALLVIQSLLRVMLTKQTNLPLP
jgi:hypothetical protein